MAQILAIETVLYENVSAVRKKLGVVRDRVQKQSLLLVLCEYTQRVVTVVDNVVPFFGSVLYSSGVCSFSKNQLYITGFAAGIMYAMH